MGNLSISKVAFAGSSAIGGAGTGGGFDGGGGGLYGNGGSNDGGGGGVFGNGASNAAGVVESGTPATTPEGPAEAVTSGSGQEAGPGGAGGAFGGSGPNGGDSLIWGGGAALGAAMFVRAGASISYINVSTDVGAVTGGSGQNTEANAGLAYGSAFFLAGPTTVSISTGTTEAISGTIADIGADPNESTDTAAGGTAVGFTAASITKAGTGTLKLSGGYSAANNYGGGTTIQAGILQAPTYAALGTGGVTFTGGTFQYLANQPFDLSSRTVSINSGGGTIDTNGNNITFASAIGSGGSGSFTKAGAGTLTLNAVATYTGGTTISGGTLVAPQGNAFTATGLNSLGEITMNGGTLALPSAGNILVSALPLSVSGFNNDVVIDHGSAPILLPWRPAIACPWPVEFPSRTVADPSFTKRISTSPRPAGASCSMESASLIPSPPAGKRWACLPSAAYRRRRVLPTA